MKKIQWKSVLAIFSVLILCLALSACGGGDNEDSGRSSTRNRTSNSPRSASPDDSEKENPYLGFWIAGDESATLEFIENGTLIFQDSYTSKNTIMEYDSRTGTVTYEDVTIGLRTADGILYMEDADSGEEFAFYREGSLPEREPEYDIHGYYYMDGDPDGRIFFYSDGDVDLENAEETIEGTWSIQGDTLTIFIEGNVSEFHIVDGETLYSDDMETYFYSDISLASPQAALNGTPENQANGKVKYSDSVRNLAVTYPSDMSILALDDTGVAVSDNSAGFVTCRNVTDWYWEYPLSDDDFALACMRAYVISDFSRLYGEITAYSEPNAFYESPSNRLGTADMTISGDGFEIYVRLLIYRTISSGNLTDNVMAKAFYAYSDNTQQFDYLYNNVTNLVTSG